jgi:DNA replication protein DnaC
MFRSNWKFQSSFCNPAKGNEKGGIEGEVGYVPFAQVGAVLLFQVISERAERATLSITMNLPFSEWTEVLPNASLCKALLDRVTDRAHIIETGMESYRFRRTLQSRKPLKKQVPDT